jgi:Cdc6-like AAA superfamily ATPase
MTNFPSIASIYNPDLLSKDQLIDSYVVRLKKFDKLFADIKTADMENPEQHLMLVGLKGMGKTTLLRRLAYEVENDPGLNTWLVPIFFNEEEYGINPLFKLWETIAKYLEKRDVAFVGLLNEMDQTYTRLKDDVYRYEQEVFELLLERLHKHQKKLLLFIDNFGDMFERFTKKNEKQRLREILMTCADLRIIAASAVVMEALFRYDDPLYEFFKIERLEGLDFEETKTLLLKLGAHIPDNPIQKIIDEQPQRIEALRRLTGGIPGSMVLFFDNFIKDKEGTALTDLEKNP